MKCNRPIRIIGNVEQIWIDGNQIFARMKDGTYRTLGDSEPIRADMYAENGQLMMGEWEYPAGWPNIEGWTIRKTTVSQWESAVYYSPAIFKADGTLWIDFDSNDDSNPYTYAGR